MASVRLLHRLRLWEDVFMVPDSVPAVTVTRLSGAGTSLLAAAYDTLRAWSPKVGRKRRDLPVLFL